MALFYSYAPLYIESALAALLQGRHLYQSELVNVDLPDEIAAGTIINREETRVAARQLLSGRWLPLPASRERRLPPDPRALPDNLSFGPPFNIRLTCRSCKERQAFVCTGIVEHSEKWRPRFADDTNDVVQTFTLEYECQACLGPPDVFVVRRSGVRLTLCGRAPMELASIPSVIPKAPRDFFTGAVIAHQSGHTLEALFMCRTLIEQWVRLCCPDGTAHCDAVLERYMDSLPADFRSRFPSMRKLYADVSAALHSANADEDLFDRSISEITEHFEARRLFKLSEPDAKPAKEPQRDPSAKSGDDEHPPGHSTS